MQPRMIMNFRESEFIFIYSYAVISAVRVEYIFIWTSFPLSLSLSVISCGSALLYRSVPVKIFCLKQRARDRRPKFTPSECINVFVKKQGAAGLKLSLPHRNVQRGAEQMVFYMHSKTEQANCPAVLNNLMGTGANEVRKGILR